MKYSHIPVLYEEVMHALAVKPEDRCVDGTLGGGGHAAGICERLCEKGVFIGIDRDEHALEAARIKLEPFPCKKYLLHGNYADIRLLLAGIGMDRMDCALLDLGVSSFQLDDSKRGFSYRNDAPLDMRMNAQDVLTADEIVNSYSEGELARIIKDYGEERWAARIAKFIVAARRKKRIESSFELVDIIKSAIPAKARREGPHPAKRTFQALRIEVNDELGQLRNAMTDFMDLLAPGGRLAVISFHSLEDRIVKEAFNERLNPCICPPDLPVCVCGKVADIRKITRRPAVAGDKELSENPRSRSAKLRVVEKIES